MPDESSSPVGNASPSKAAHPYWCFISYRHADNKAEGRQWATWLHQAIETYEVPEDLVGVVNDRGDTIPERIFPVFRDEEELPADAHLASPIYRALDRSRFLVVLCSPRAVASTYVDDEIRYFKKQGGSDRILAAMLEGEPNASWDAGKHAAGVGRERECFPLALQHPVNAEGQLITRERAEPIAADFRLDESGQQGWTTPEAYRRALVAKGDLGTKAIEERVGNYRRQCELAKLKIIAGILGIPLGKLTRRDVAYQLTAARRRARVLRRWLGAVAALAALATVGGVIAWRQKQIATTQEREANTQRGKAQERATEALEANRKYKEQLHQASMSDWVRAKGLFAVNNWPEGMAYLGRALRYEPENRVAAGWLWSEVVYDWSQNGRDHLPERLLVHECVVNSVVYSPDGARLLTAGEDGVARSWDAATGHATGTSLFHEDSVVDVAFSPDGTRVLTVSGQSVRFWDAASGQPVGRPMLHDHPPVRAVFNRAGTRVLTFCPEYRDRMTTLGEARLWDVATGEPVGAPLRHGISTVRPIRAEPTAADLFASLPGRRTHSADEALIQAAFSADGTRVLTVSRGQVARLWHGETGQAIATLTQTGPVTDASFSPDGKRVLLAADQDLRWWDAADGKPLGPDSISEQVTAVAGGFDPSTYNLISKNNTRSVAFSADGTRVVAATDNGEATVRDAKLKYATGESMRHPAAIASAAFSPNGQHVATVCRDQIVRIWQVGPRPELPESLDHFYPVATALNPDPARLLTVTLSSCFGGGGQLAAWDLSAGQYAGEFLGYDPSLTNPVLSLDQSRMLFTGSAQSHDAYLFDLRERKWLGPPLRHEGPVQKAVFSPDASRVVTVSSDSILKLWDAATGEPVGDAQILDEPLVRVAYSRDGSRIIASTSTQTHEWDAVSGERREVKHEDPVSRHRHLESEAASAVLSPDARLILTTATSGNEAHLWDAATGLPMSAPLKHAGDIMGAIFSNDGARIVTVGHRSAHGSGGVRVWECVPSLPLPPPWLDQFVEALSGWRFDEHGGLKPLTVQERVSGRAAVLAALKSSGGQEAEWDRLAAWIFAPLDQRKLTPRSDVTIAQRFERMEANDLANQNARDAAANQPRIFRPDADYWVKRADERVRTSGSKMQLEFALEEVGKAVSADPKHVLAHRLTSRFLERLQRFDEALAAYKLLVELPGATAVDFANAGYMSALRGWSDEAKAFFGQATQRFPQEESVARMEGWALLNLRMPEPALAAFRRSEALIVAAQKKPGADLLAGVVITSWLVEKADDAVQEYRRLIALDAKYGDEAKVRAFAWSEAEVKSMLAALAETLRRHPELAPRSSAPN